MTIPPNTQAVLLLTSYFSKSGGDSVKPLSPKEWGRFALWLKNHDLTPEQLMGSNPNALITQWKDDQITLDRLKALLSRGSALALALEKWLRAGLWVLSRSDSAYPARLKKLLGTDSPALLFGCGNQNLLNRGGLAVVGSRNGSEDVLQYARKLGSTIAAQGYNVVSGGARGVDEAAMLGNLENDGSTVGVLADNLLRACTSKRFRRHLLEDRLALISFTYPEARFNAGNAMQRNKYIYCLSDAALVVHSGKKGGTWNGATENLRKRWVPLWVKRVREGDSGNAELVKKGGIWVSENTSEISIHDLLSVQDFAIPKRTELSTVGEQRVNSLLDSQSENHHQLAKTGDSQSCNESEFYELFLKRLSETCVDNPQTPLEISKLLDLQKTQLNIWLKRAHAENKIRKLSKPVRYEWVISRQTSLF